MKAEECVMVVAGWVRDARGTATLGMVIARR